jgi:hypothetical protein
MSCIQLARDRPECKAVVKSAMKPQLSLSRKFLRACATISLPGTQMAEIGSEVIYEYQINIPYF